MGLQENSICRTASVPDPYLPSWFFYVSFPVTGTIPGSGFTQPSSASSV